MELELGEYYKNGRGEVLRITNMGIEMIDGCDCVTFFDQNGFEYVPNGVMVCSDSVEDYLFERVVVVSASDLDDGPCICDECMSEQEADAVAMDAGIGNPSESMTLSEAIGSVIDDIMDTIKTENVKSNNAGIELEEGGWYWCTSFDDDDSQMVYVAVYSMGLLMCVNGEQILPHEAKIISKIEKPEVE